MFYAYLNVAGIKGLRKTVGCSCTVLRGTKFLCKMCPFLEKSRISSCPTNESILKGGAGLLGALLHLLVSWTSLLFAGILICSSFSQPLVIQTVQWFLCVKKSMPLRYLNNRDRYLLSEPVRFFGLVGYFWCKPKKRVYLKLSRRKNIYMKARKDF